MGIWEGILEREGKGGRNLPAGDRARFTIGGHEQAEEDAQSGKMTLAWAYFSLLLYNQRMDKMGALNRTLLEEPSPNNCFLN